MKVLSILLVDDNKNFLRVLSYQLNEMGCHTDTVAGAADALDRLNKHYFDLVITDLMMPGMDGLELVDRIHRSDPGLPVIILTAHELAADDAIQKGAAGLLTKPCNMAEMQQAIATALKLTGLKVGPTGADAVSLSRQ